MRGKGENLVRFLSLILDKLIQLMVRPPVLGGQPGRCRGGVEGWGLGVMVLEQSDWPNEGQGREPSTVPVTDT